MNYVMSDIHGHFDEFLNMLQKIKFSDDDTLFVLGDVVDRGEKPIELLLYILAKPNIVLLMGNHEKMMLDAYCTTEKKLRHAQDLWLHNGGGVTDSTFAYLDSEQRLYILDALSSLPLYCRIEVGGVKYFLSHAGVCIRDGETLEDAIEADVETGRILWNRHEMLFWHNTSDVIMIHGHTPSGRWHPEQKYEILHYEDGKKINIDCGCSRYQNLGCLCLETMEAHYEPCKNIFSF